MEEEFRVDYKITFHVKARDIEEVKEKIHKANNSAFREFVDVHHAALDRTIKVVK